VDHGVLLSILGKRIKDDEVLWLISTILANHKTPVPGKGMPLGNLTSQFFANVYLAELDNFVKHGLRAKCYLRYVDDFVILSRNRACLQDFQERINQFLAEKLKIRLHPQKTRIIPLGAGITLLGFRVFYHYKLLKKSNQRRIGTRLLKFRHKLEKGEMSCAQVRSSIAGWEGYAKMADTYALRMRIRKQEKAICQDFSPSSTGS
jgi:hypothetical protein